MQSSGSDRQVFHQDRRRKGGGRHDREVFCGLVRFYSLEVIRPDDGGGVSAFVSNASHVRALGNAIRNVAVPERVLFPVHFLFVWRAIGQGLIHGGNVSEGLLNMVEMAFRAYDPCLGCATHSLPGHVPLSVNLYGPDHRLVRQLVQD